MTVTVHVPGIIEQFRHEAMICTGPGGFELTQCIRMSLINSREVFGREFGWLWTFEHIVQKRSMDLVRRRVSLNTEYHVKHTAVAARASKAFGISSCCSPCH
jgi:hypothetical protein